MLRDDAIAEIKKVLGFRSDLTNAIVATLQSEQISLEDSPTKPWFLLSEDSTTLTTPEEPRIGLPTDFLCEYEDGALWYVPDTDPEEQLIKKDYDYLKKVYRGCTSDEPKRYALRGDYFVLFPTPAAAYTIRMVYYKRAPALTSNIENGWLKHASKLLMGVTGKTIAAGLRDVAAVSVFAEWERLGRLQLFTRNEDREHTNRDYQMGGPD